MRYIEEQETDPRTWEKLSDIFSRSFTGYWKEKRVFDIIVSLMILTVVLPVMVLVWVAVFLENPKAKPIYKQKRVGRHGKIFIMYKFRTMCPGADRMKADLESRNEMDGPVFKIRDDPRITRIGKFLRKTSLDELPQFFNVLKGDMSLVGPRPPLPGEVAQYTDYQKLRLLVTPGITCEWQITKNRNDMPFDQWVELDLHWIANRTFWGDVLIILKTPFAMLSATGR